jgi:hypothetical protein
VKRKLDALYSSSTNSNLCFKNAANISDHSIDWLYVGKGVGGGACFQVTRISMEFA